jgi:predicted homoserine dehydrogenase-like protein
MLPDRVFQRRRLPSVGACGAASMGAGVSEQITGWDGVQTVVVSDSVLSTASQPCSPIGVAAPTPWTAAIQGVNHN